MRGEHNIGVNQLVSDLRDSGLDKVQIGGVGDVQVVAWDQGLG